MIQQKYKEKLENEKRNEILDRLIKNNTSSGKNDKAIADLQKQKEIAELEKEVLQQKSWDMLGESSNKDRPENSLLELDLDYQQTVKVAPTITAEVTQTLEEMIKQRINDEMWDDVERQVEDQGDKRKRVLDEVSTEKSKLGLGDIYAKEYEENNFKVVKRGGDYFLFSSEYYRCLHHFPCK